MDELREKLEQLKAIGQTGAEEEAQKLESLHQDLQTQAKQLRETLQAALALREQYYRAKADMETCLKDCSDQLDAVNAVGVSISTKLERYKAVVDEIEQKESQFVQLEKQAEQIGSQGTAGDKQAVQGHVTALRDKAESLKRRAQREAEQFEKVLSDRQDFSSGLSGCTEALKTADLSIQPQTCLPLDTEGVDTELNKYYDHKDQLVAKVATMHEQCEEQKARFTELDEAMPLELAEQIEEFENLREKVTTKLNEQVRNPCHLLPSIVQYRIQKYFRGQTGHGCLHLFVASSCTGRIFEQSQRAPSAIPRHVTSRRGLVEECGGTHEPRLRRNRLRENR